jgi:dipeptidyl-peptidase-4
MSYRTLSAACIFLAALIPFQSIAQTTPVRRANWTLANRFSAESLRPFIYSSNVTPGWINKTENFWYSWRDGDGIKFWLVNAKTRKKSPLFDSARMAELLSQALKKPYDTTNLPITTVVFDEKNDNLLRFAVDGIRFEYEIGKDEIKNIGRGPLGRPAGAAGQGGRGGGGGGQGFGQGLNRDFRNYSPDKKSYVYAMDHNLYEVDVVDGKDQPPVQLTKDGEKDYSFGSRQAQTELQQQFQQQQQQQQQQIDQQGDQQGQGGGGGNPSEKRVRANVTWSKDSKKFYVTRGDSRKVKELFLVNNLADPRPTLMTYKYSMPGDADVTQTELFVYDRDAKELTKLAVDKYKDQRLSDIHWQDTTSDSLRFVRRDRLQRNLEVCEVDLKSKAVKPLLTESVENSNLEAMPIKYVKPGGDFVWYSERTGWGHFYLYSNDGKLLNPITSGAYKAASLVDVDADKKYLYFQGNGREANENPYYRHLYRIGLDGKNLQLLDPGDADHNSTLSTDKKYVVDNYSRTDLAPRVVLHDDSGKVIAELEESNMASLTEMGWKMPETFKVKAADGVTDIYGNMWKPFDFDPKKKYPIITNVYPGPQTESVSTGFGANSTNQRLAQLGFIVVQFGNRGGNPARSNAYHSYGYFNLRDYGLADKKAGIEQLAARNAWIDIDRVGIYGHSGGGFMTGAAMMLPPYNDFFKVGVASSGNHDNNIYNQNWSEQYHGLKEVPIESGGTSTGTGQRPPSDVLDDPVFGPTNDLDLDFDSAVFQQQQEQKLTGTKFDIHVPTNAELAPNLKGKLLLVTGDMDNNVHPANTIRLVNALIKANKRFDFMIMPGKPHGYGDMQPYFTQLMFEYFVEHLMGDNYRSSADMNSHN